MSQALVSLELAPPSHSPLSRCGFRYAGRHYGLAKEGAAAGGEQLEQAPL